MSDVFKEFGKAFERFASATAQVIRDDDNIKNYDIRNNIKVINVSELENIIEIPRYGVFIEYGRRKGAKMPPHDPIKKWAIKRNIFSSSDKKADGITYLIRKGISENGIKPKPFIFDNVDDMVEDLLSNPAIYDAIGIDISNNIRDLF